MVFLGVLFYLLAGVFCIGAFVCFIMVLVKMFQNDESTMGIVCILLFLCTGIGSLIAFVIGWMNVKKWNIQQIMNIWTVCFIGSFVFAIIGVVLVMMGAVNAQDQLHQFPMQNM